MAAQMPVKKVEKAHTDRPKTKSPDRSGESGPPSRFIGNPALMMPDELLAVQRMIGNRAMAALIQTKLTIGPPGDRYEQEADRVAEQIMQMGDSAAGPMGQPAAGVQREEVQMQPLAATITPLVQRQEEEEEVQAKLQFPIRRQEEEEEEVQAKSQFPIRRQEEEEEEVQAKSQFPIRRQEEEEEEVQAKFQFPIRRQEEEEEEEVQAKSQFPIRRQEEEEEEEVQAKFQLPIQRQEEEEEEEVQAKFQLPIQRQEEEEEEEVQAKSQFPIRRQEEEEETVQAKSRSPSVQLNLEQRLATQKGKGQPLSAEVRAFMEPRFGVDLGGVRVHTGGEAVQLTQALKAQAFTHGQDVYFGAGKYDPGTDAGKRLLAHELTHVVQQSGGRLQRRAAQVVSLSTTPEMMLQRLMTREEVEERGGSPSWKAKIARSSYKRILKSLEKYAKETKREKKLEILSNLWSDVNFWLKTHDQTSRPARRQVLLDLRQSISAEITTLAQGGAGLASSIVEQAWQSGDASTICKAFATALNILEARVNSLVRAKKQGQVPAEEVQATGKDFFRVYSTLYQLISVIKFPNQKRLRGKLEESIRASLVGDAESKKGDPRQLYQYVLVGDAGKRMSARELQTQADAAAREILRTRGISTLSDWYNTNEGRNFREAYSWLTKPPIKRLYDLYLDNPKKFAKYEKLLGKQSVLDALLERAENLRMTMTELPGGSQAVTVLQKYY